jgi:hypothetical protein
MLVQQAAEKALKAALISLDIDPPRVRNLELLADLLPEGWTVRSATQDLLLERASLELGEGGDERSVLTTLCYMYRMSRVRRDYVHGAECTDEQTIKDPGTDRSEAPG